MKYCIESGKLKITLTELYCGISEVFSDGEKLLSSNPGSLLP